MTETGRTSHYLHGTSPEEQERLSRLNDFINEASLRELNLHVGARVLEVGCGLGQFARETARVAGPSGFVVGIDRSEDQLSEARSPRRTSAEMARVEFRLGEAYALPLSAAEWGTFDVVHTRFLLEHLREPEAVVEQMVRAAKLGGRIILEDDDHDVLRHWPEEPAIEKLWRAYLETYHRLGNDPFVGRRLVSLLREAGATPLRNTILFFGACRGNLLFDAVMNNLHELLCGAGETIVGEGLQSSSDFRAGLDAITSWRSRPDAALWYGIFWAEGMRPVA